MGPTASGKTDLAERLAEELDAQLINADAFQAYVGMDIGTAKPRRRSLYRLVDIKRPNQWYGMGEFCSLAQTELEVLYNLRRNAVVVGGTGLYIRALFEQYAELDAEPDPSVRNRLQDRLKTEGLERLFEELRTLDPDKASRVDSKNPVRVTRALERSLSPKRGRPVVLPPYSVAKVGLCGNVAALNARIDERTHLMVQNGWVQEVKRLLSIGFGPDDPGFRAIGYRQIASYVEGKTDLEEAIATTIAETRRYAKRQRTWLRSEPRLLEIDPANQDICKEAMQKIRSVMQ